MTQKDFDRWEWLAIAMAALILFVGCMLNSCATKKEVVQTDYRDSVQKVYIHDTTIIAVHDTCFVEVERKTETEEGTTIEYAAGGGSYNVQTGEANNVQRVKTDKKTKEQEHTIAELKSEKAYLQARCDSLLKANKVLTIFADKEQNTQDIKPQKGGWHTFLVWWFWISLLLLLVQVFLFVFWFVRLK